MVEKIREITEYKTSDIPNVGELMAERVKSGSNPGYRKDNFHLSAVLEGGLMRGSITAGEAAGLWALDAIKALDSVYVVSSAAPIGAYSVSGQTKEALPLCWEEYCLPEHVNILRPFVGKPIVDIKAVRNVMDAKMPLDFAKFVDQGINFHIILAAAEDATTVDLNNFTSRRELIDTICFSMEVPFLTGKLHEKYGMPLVDGTLAIGGLAVEEALSNGSTHILTLLSGSREVLKRNKFLENIYSTLLARQFPELAQAYKNGFQRHNFALSLISESQNNPNSQGAQIDAISARVSDGAKISRFERDPKKIQIGTVVGYNATLEKLKPYGLDVVNHPYKDSPIH